MLKTILVITLLLAFSCKKDAEYNPYLSEGGDGSKTKIKGPDYLLKVDKNIVRNENLPKELKFLNYRLGMENYLKLYNAIESYGVRLAYQEEKGFRDKDEDRNLVPTLVDLFSEEVKEKEIEEFIKNNPREFNNNNYSDEQKKAAAKYKLLVDVITPRYLKKRIELFNNQRMHVNVLPPDIRETGVRFDYAPRLGSKDAPLELMVVSNYVCEACRKFDGQISKLYKKFGNNMSYLHVNHIFYPNTVAFDSVLAGHCLNIGDAQKYWRFHKEIYDHKKVSSLKREDREEFKTILGAIFSKINVDKKKIFSCMANETNQKVISERVLTFKSLGVRGLPLYYLNGRQLILLEEEGLEAAFINMAKSLGISITNP